LGELLPEQSKGKYEAEYRKFCEWAEEKGVKTFDEDVFLAYFLKLSTTYVPTSLWSIYSMLRSTMDVHRNIRLEHFTKLYSFIKRKNVGYNPKKARVFKASEVKQFLETALDEQWLVHKVS